MYSCPAQMDNLTPIKRKDNTKDKKLPQNNNTPKPNKNSDTKKLSDVAIKGANTGVNTANNKQNKDSKKQPNQSMINHYNHTTDTTQKKNMKNTIDETKVVSNKSTHNINIYEPSEYYYVQNTNGYPNNCCITSLATVVSHNTNQKIEPNNKNISVEKININNKEYPRNNLDGSDYNSNKKAIIHTHVPQLPKS